MNILPKKIKYKLISLITLLIIILVSNVLYVSYNIYWQNLKSSNSLFLANKMSDYLLKAAAHQAIERGISNSLISKSANKQVIPTQLQNKIQKLRIQSNENLQKAIELAEQVIELGDTNVLFTEVLDETKNALEKFNQARILIDQLSPDTPPKIQNKDWLNMATGLINSEAELRLTVFLNNKHSDMGRMNGLIFKQAVWMASEYAGLERALIGSILSRNEAMSEKEYLQLKAYRAIVDVNLALLNNSGKRIFKQHQTIDDQNNHYVAALNTMQQLFGQEFQQIRESIYALKNTGQYPYSVSEWLTSSTRAINSILALNDSISADALNHAQLYKKNSLNLFARASIVLISSVLIGLIGLLVIFKIVRRLSVFEEIIVQSQKNNDLTVRLNDDNDDELSNIAKAFNQMFDKFQMLIIKTRETIITIKNESESLGIVTEISHDGSSMQKNNSIKLTSAMNKIRETVNLATKNSIQAARQAEEANQSVIKGQEAVVDTIKCINTLSDDIKYSAQVIKELEKDSDNISQILAVIKDVAEQTNLLALNASIEAARAGEQGRGFAVVADEVRMLAQRTQNATIDIQKSINQLQTSSSNSVAAIENSLPNAVKSVEKTQVVSAMLSEIVSSVAIIAHMNDDISVNAQGESSEVLAMEESVQQGIHVIDLLSDGASHLKEAGKELHNLAVDLDELINEFKV